MFGQATFLLFLVSFDKECSITLTGGDTISVRFLYKEEFDYKPKFKLIFCVNKLPGIKGVDHGIWRRVIVDQLILQPQPPQRDGFAVGSKVPTEQNSLDTRSWVFGGIRCACSTPFCQRIYARAPLAKKSIVVDGLWPSLSLSMRPQSG